MFMARGGQAEDAMTPVRLGVRMYRRPARWRVRPYRYGWGWRRPGYGVLGLLIGLVALGVLAFFVCTLFGLLAFRR